MLLIRQMLKLKFLDYQLHRKLIVLDWHEKLFRIYVWFHRICRLFEFFDAFAVFGSRDYAL